ncbi:MAG TPA: alpha/beta hydrolase [Ideonella sp.]|nr:alpha/beta hydrolase [Ideonella sp.]
MPKTPRAGLAVLALAAVLAGCAAERLLIAPLGQASFEAYRRETTAWLQQQRSFQTPDHARELAWNGPLEWRPAGTPRQGIVLLHGLGDSPWSFADIGPRLAERGFLVRAVLLPGHGTKPADLIGVDIADWRQLLQEQVALLAQEVPQVWLGGFSTGANLALEYALTHDEVGGLLLFSPALKSGVAVDWVMPLVAWAKPWLRSPDSPEVPQQTPLRYLNVPSNGFAQYVRSSTAVRASLDRKPYDKPALIVSAEHDSVVDVDYVLGAFQRRFTHPASRMVWYGALPAGAGGSPGQQRVLARPDHLPAERISQFSHMSVLFSPANPLYGRDGPQRICWNGQDGAERARCFAGDTVWYADWGYTEPGKVHARLTFNPYFEWQDGVMAQVLGGPPVRTATALD